MVHVRIFLFYRHMHLENRTVPSNRNPSFVFRAASGIIRKAAIRSSHPFVIIIFLFQIREIA